MDEKIYFDGRCLIVNGRVENACGMAVNCVEMTKAFLNTADFAEARLNEVSQYYRENSDFKVIDADNFIKSSKFFNPERVEPAIAADEVKAIGGSNAKTCVKCGRKVSDKVLSFCEQKGLEPLCYNCQPHRKSRK